MANKVYRVIVRPPKEEDQTFTDGENERPRLRDILVSAESEAAAKEAAIEQSLAIAAQYGGEPWRVTSVKEA